MLLEIEDRRGQILESSSQVDRHRDRLEKHFRHQDRRAQIERDSARQRLDDRGEDAEVPGARRSRFCGRKARMLVIDIGPDGKMDGRRDPELVGRGEQADLPERRPSLQELAPQSLSQAFAALARDPGPFVEPTRCLVGHSELSFR